MARSVRRFSAWILPAICGVLWACDLSPSAPNDGRAEPLDVALRIGALPDTLVVGGTYAVPVLQYVSAPGAERPQMPPVPVSVENRDSAMAHANLSPDHDSLYVRPLRPGTLDIALRISGSSLVSEKRLAIVRPVFVEGIRLRPRLGDSAIVVTALNDLISVVVDGVGAGGTAAPFAPAAIWVHHGKSFLQDFLSPREWQGRSAKPGVDTLIVSALEYCRGQCADTVVMTVSQVPTRFRAQSRFVSVASLGEVIRIPFWAYDRNDAPVLGVSPRVEITADSLVILSVQGQWRSVANGAARGIISLGALADTVSIEVRQRVASVQFSRPSLTPVAAIGVAPETTLVAAYDAQGNLLARPPVWSLGAGASTVAQIAIEPFVVGRSRLIARAMRVGEDVLAVLADSLSSPMRVRGVALVSVRIAPSDSTVLAVDDTSTLAISAFDALGRAARPLVRWLSRDTARVSVDAQGHITGRVAGTAVVVGEVGLPVGVLRDSVRVIVLEASARRSSSSPAMKAGLALFSPVRGTR